MSEINQSSAMVVRNQPEFPMVLQMRWPSDLFSAEEINQNGSLSAENAIIVDVVVDGEPAPGDHYIAPWSNSKAHFREVYEKRQAKGVWDTPTFVGTKPMWYRCICQLEIVPK